MDIVALAVFASALMITAGTPGPSIAALVTRVIAKGWRDIAPFIAAMWIGEVLWLSLAIAGLAALAETFHGAFLVLKYLGVAYLLWLAWKMWSEPVADGDAPLPTRGSGWSMFAAGMALTLGNPKIVVFYLALLPTLIDLTAVSFGQWAILVCVTVVSLAAVDLAWVAAAHQARRVLRTPRAIRIANRIGAGALGGAAGVIAMR